LENCLFLHK